MANTFPTPPVKRPQELSLSKSEMAVLPLIPVLLAARAEGYPCEAKREQVLQAMLALDVDPEGVDVVVRVLSRRPTERDAALLMAFGVLLRKKKIACDLPQTFNWALRVLAIGNHPASQVLCGRPAAMLRMLHIGLYRSCGPSVLDTLAKPHGIRVDIPIKDDFQQAMQDIFSPGSEEVSGAEWPTVDYAPGRIMNSLPVLGIPNTVPLLANSADYFPNRFLKLLAGSLSLSNAEKRRVLIAIPELSQFQIDELFKVWIHERNEFDGMVPVKKFIYMERAAAIRWLALYKTQVPSDYLKEPWKQGLAG